jgi:uncharacterized protein YkwD
MLRSLVKDERRRGRPVAVVLAVSAVAASVSIASVLPTARLGAEPAEAKSTEPCPYAHSGPSSLNQAQASEAILCLINKKRASHGDGPLAANDKLASAAQSHTNHMLERGCFDHACPGETQMTSRIEKTGYPNGTWGLGENIAAAPGGRGSPAKVVQSWMDSRAHRMNILKGAFEHLGVGMGHGTPWKPKGGGATYTTDFGYTAG